MVVDIMVWLNEREREKPRQRKEGRHVDRKNDKS